MIERRRFPRYDRNFNVSYSTQGLAAIESLSSSKNISQCGIRMPISRIIKSGDLLRIEIDLKDKKPPVSIVGKVIWTRNFALQSPLKSDAGIEFARVAPADTERLAQALR